jgi:hypothetical protein
MVVEAAGETTADAIRLYARGCAAKNVQSCEALTSTTGPLRAQALAEGCKGGDLLACVRRANDLPADERSLDEARAVRHGVCKQSVEVKPGTSARDLEAIADACSGLSRMIAAGEGGGRDMVAAAKLDVLAGALRNEALYQHEREDDAKPLPPPAKVPAPVPTRKGAPKKAPKVDPTAEARGAYRRDIEARRAAREAWVASVDARSNAISKKAAEGNPTIPTPSPFERATAVFHIPAPASTASCHACVEGCGSAARCSASDDFLGGHCAYLRATDSTAADGCVAECNSRVDACAKACGECPAEAPAAPPAPTPAKGAKAQ